MSFTSKRFKNSVFSVNPASLCRPWLLKSDMGQYRLYVYHKIACMRDPKKARSQRILTILSYDSKPILTSLQRQHHQLAPDRIAKKQPQKPARYSSGRVFLLFSFLFYLAAILKSFQRVHCNWLPRSKLKKKCNYFYYLRCRAVVFAISLHLVEYLVISFELFCEQSCKLVG